MYELFFKYIHKSRLLKKWGGNYIYMKEDSSWQVFNFLLYKQSSILQDILFYIWYLTICFWIDWVHVYNTRKLSAHRFKYERNYIIAREQKKWWTWHVISVIAENETMKVHNTQPISHAICPIEVLLIKIFLCSLRFFFFSTTCSKVISTFKQ